MSSKLPQETFNKLIKWLEKQPLEKFQRVYSPFGSKYLNILLCNKTLTIRSDGDLS